MTGRGHKGSPASPDEPAGHRGHAPRQLSLYLDRTRARLEAMMDRLEAEDFSHEEAIRFISDIAFVKGKDLGETWARPENAVRTVTGLVDLGFGGPVWGLEALNLALKEAEGLLEP